MDFDSLTSLRVELQALSAMHGPALLCFRDESRTCFGINEAVSMIDVGEEHPSEKSLRHVTSSTTCIESLYDMPRRELMNAQPGQSVTSRQSNKEIYASFTELALRYPDEWESDSAAHVYCRVRGLAPLLRLRADRDFSSAEKAVVTRLLRYAWASHEPGALMGLRERGGYLPKPFMDEAEITDEELVLLSSTSTATYPANAFLTYWGMVALDSAREFSAELGNLHQKRFATARAWMRDCLNTQIALHFATSPLADPQQLGWAICGLVAFPPEDLASKSSPSYTSLAAGLRAFFEQQDPQRGTWDPGKPLFHYPSAGNAYCYTFETLGELLSLATTASSPERDVFVDALRPYFANLRLAYQDAKETSRTLAGQTILKGWSSGHHPHRLQPESWATASVYRFIEHLRRLVGRWTREAVLDRLGASWPLDGTDVLRERGDTWAFQDDSAGIQLSTRYLNPIRRAESQRASDPLVAPDPDDQVVPTGGLRSAMLFGPPGTGKTTLVKAVAGVLGWPFIEITPAVFLDHGVDLVSKRADEVFSQVMELDRCVVLLDEIDELIRHRGNAETLERFFTTSMLPRLAHLWAAGRILFFVNTNDITQVDPAIRRSQRFDSAILVLPPSFEVKRTILAEHGVQVTFAEQTVVDKAMAGGSDLGWLALLRFDQVERYAEACSKGPLDEAQATFHLPPFRDELLNLDWSIENGRKKKTEVHGLLAPLVDSQRVDSLSRPLVYVPPAVVDAEAEQRSVIVAGLGATGNDGYAEVPLSQRHRARDWVAETTGRRLLPDGSVEWRDAGAGNPDQR